MTDPNAYPKSDYGRNVNSPDVVIIGAGISGAFPRHTLSSSCSYLPVRLKCQKESVRLLI